MRQDNNNRDNRNRNAVSPNQEVRLNKYIADAGVASRRKADELIEAGEVKINGKVVTELGSRVKPGDRVTVGGNPITSNRHFKYIMLNKPKNVITTTKDESDRQTVMDIVHTADRVYPVGRLDRNTTGLLLLTNDGEMANRLLHPKYRIERMYNVNLDKNLSYEDAKKISLGLELEDGKTSPCEIFISPEDRSKVSIILKEGKNREVRRIFESLDYKVKQLDRKEFAGLTTKGLNKGEYRHLTKDEVFRLKRMVGL